MSERQDELWDALMRRVAMPGSRTNPGRGGYIVPCPAHDDPTASLSFYFDGERIQIRCFAGCDTDRVIEAMGYDWPDRLPPMNGSTIRVEAVPTRRSQGPRARGSRDHDHPIDWSSPGVTYPCTDPEGVVWIHARWDHGCCDTKTMIWKPKGGGASERIYVPRPLTHQGRLFVTEGEKAADAVAAIGLDVIGLAGGSASPPARATLRTWVHGYERVTTWPDADRPGRYLMADVMAELRDLVDVVESVEPSDAWAKGTDAADLLYPKLGAAELHELATEPLDPAIGPSDRLREILEDRLVTLEQIMRRPL